MSGASKDWVTVRASQAGPPGPIPVNAWLRVLDDPDRVLVVQIVSEEPHRIVRVVRAYLRENDTRAMPEREADPVLLEVLSRHSWLHEWHVEQLVLAAGELHTLSS